MNQLYTAGLWLLLAVAWPAHAAELPDLSKSKAVALFGGCLVVPAGAHVVITDGHVDSFTGYVQVSDGARKVSWLGGMIASRVGSGDYATTLTESGDEIRYVAFTTAGVQGFVAEIGPVQFLISGTGESDRQYLLSVARRFRTDIPGQLCERPENGKPAF